MIVKLFQGFCTALADSVPGVSGGTVAFILGFYEQFIGALHALFGKDSAARKAAFVYLVKLGIGWGIGLVASILFILLEEQKSMVGKWKTFRSFCLDWPWYAA